MSKEEFLKRLETALSGEVPAAVIRDNVSYYADYISQEMGKGRTMDEIVEEIGEPNIVARTIIDSSEAAGEAGDGAYEDASYRQESYGQSPNIHYFNLNKWYWKLLLAAGLVVVATAVFSIIGGVFALLARFAGPLLMIFLIYQMVKNFRK